MNKLLTYGMSSLLGLTLASPAMALTGFGQSTQYNGPHWTNHFEGQGPWNSNTYGPGYLSQNGYTYNARPYHGQNQSQTPNGNYGPNEYYGQYRYGQTRNYGPTDNNGAGALQVVSHGFLAQLQRRLQQEGFYHQGNVDGLWGPRIENALVNFQQKNNLRPTGQIDMPTLEALNLLNTGNGTQYGQNGPQYGQNRQGPNPG